MSSYDRFLDLPIAGCFLQVLAQQDRKFLLLDKALIGNIVLQYSIQYED